MKISHKWLSEYCQLNLTPEQIAPKLTEIGLEVEHIHAYESLPNNLKGVLVGEITSLQKHPDADKLQLTEVKIREGEILPIVCGAKNIAIGQKVLVATEGTMLPTTNNETFTIKKSKIRGQISCGMICAEDELGLGKNHDGVMVLPQETPIGTTAADYLNLQQDHIFEIGLTPNRSDAASHFGVARDLMAAFSLENLKAKTISPNCPIINDFPEKKIDLNINVESKNCKRYNSIVLKNIKISESPNWLKQKIESIGLRSINNIVDISNYVMHELGQPLHIFDYEQIKNGEITVRQANSGENIQLLDGSTKKLHSEDLVIASDKTVLCLAGLMGGLASGVSEKTQTILIESAYFDPATIRKMAKRHQIYTDASFRFERGTDPNGTLNALWRAVHLIRKETKAEIASDIIDFYPEKIMPIKIDVLYQNIDRLIGEKIDTAIILQILNALEIKIIAQNEQGFTAEIPTFKTDVTQEQDVIEEIIRIYGLNRIKLPENFRLSLNSNSSIFSENLMQIVTPGLISNGFIECVNNSLSAESYYNNSDNLVHINNPLSNLLNTMRQTLLFGLLENVNFNQNRQQSNLKLFEFGKTYFKINNKNQTYQEIEQLDLLITGQKLNDSWQQKAEFVDFYTLKQYVHLVMDQIGLAHTEWTSNEEKNTIYFDYALSYAYKENIFVSFGEVKKHYLKQFEIEQPVFYANFSTKALLNILQNKNKKYQEINKYPVVKRDLSLLLDDHITFENLEKLAFSSIPKSLQKVQLFDVYKGKNLPSGKKSYALSFFLQNKNGTLSDDEIQKNMNKLITAYQEKLNASLR